jgi:hypothetical protein
MPLSLHLAIHFFSAILVGYLAGKHFKKIPLGIIVGICGGFLIDLDHILEYFLVYGPNFNLLYFIQGRQFLLSDKVHLWFHAWEYVPILLIFAYGFRKNKTVQTILITLALAGSVHLLSDSIINQYPLKFYSLIYRSEQGFSAEKLIGEANYQKNKESKLELGI